MHFLRVLLEGDREGGFREELQHITSPIVFEHALQPLVRALLPSLPCRLADVWSGRKHEASRVGPRGPPVVRLWLMDETPADEGREGGSVRVMRWCTADALVVSTISAPGVNNHKLRCEPRPLSIMRFLRLSKALATAVYYQTECRIRRPIVVIVGRIYVREITPRDTAYLSNLVLSLPSVRFKL